MVIRRVIGAIGAREEAGRIHDRPGVVREEARNYDATELCMVK